GPGRRRASPPARRVRRGGGRRPRRRRGSARPAGPGARAEAGGPGHLRRGVDGGRGEGGLVLSLALERHTLENGLRVVLAPDTTVPIVAVNLWYGVGSRNERRGRTGFAHLFEHMMFQGSLHVPKNRHFELVERAGGS